MKGLSLRQIPEGKPGAGIKVLRLHYSADPTMTPERVAALRVKFPDPSIWHKEMEIDPYARRGQRVFPGFDESMHVVDDYRLHEAYWTTYLACDPHPRRAHAFVWLCVNQIGEMVIPWSWWPEGLNLERANRNEGPLLIREYVEILRLIEDAKVFPASYVELMDPAGKNFNQDEQHNFFDGYSNEGVTWRPAKKNREYAGYDLITEALAPKTWSMGNTVEKRPRLTIMRDGGDNAILVKQFKMFRWQELKTGSLDKDPPDKPVDKDHHLIDCVSYILLHEPEFINPHSRLSEFIPIYKNLGY